MTTEDDPDWGWEFRIEDFVYARLEEGERAAKALDEPARTHALAVNTAMRGILAEHSIYVSGNQSRGRCYTCPATHGVPCTTLLAVARIWQDHPDALDWLTTDNNSPDADVVKAGTFRRLQWPQTVA